MDGLRKSSSYTIIDSQSIHDNRDKVNSEDDWCQVNSATTNKIVLDSIEGYKEENVILYLLDLMIMTNEQVQWKKFVENIDFSTDPGAIRDYVPIYDEHPSSSSTGRESPDEPIEDPSEAVVKALMEYFKNNRNVHTDSPIPIPYIDAPENLLEIYDRLPEAPKDFYIVDGQIIQLRNPSGWRPPKKTFIYEMPKFHHDVTTLLSIQGHSCAGCGSRFNKRSRPNLCSYYYNRLFCNLCFQDKRARIPARILKHFDFETYPVSDAAYRFLSENESQPVFDIHIVDQSLFRKFKNLRLIRSIRQNVPHLWEYIKRCPHTEFITTDCGILRTMFESVPSRFLSIECIYMYSILDFVAINDGNLIQMLKPLETLGSAHVLKCEICLQRGFFCQICMRPDQIIFPFQPDKIRRCEACGSLSHKSCYNTKISKDGIFVCSKCERIRKKRQLHNMPFDSSNSD